MLSTKCVAVQAMACEFDTLAACSLCAKAASSALTPSHLHWLNAEVSLQAVSMPSAHVMSLMQGAVCNSLIIEWCFLVTALLAYTRIFWVGLLKEVCCPLSLPPSMCAFLPANILPCRRQCKLVALAFKLFLRSRLLPRLAQKSCPCSLRHQTCWFWLVSHSQTKHFPPQTLRFS